MTIGHTYRFSPRDDHFGFGWETGRIARAIRARSRIQRFLPRLDWTDRLDRTYLSLFFGRSFKIFGVYSNASAWVALAVNSIFSALTCATIYYIGREVFGPRSRVAVVGGVDVGAAALANVLGDPLCLGDQPLGLPVERGGAADASPRTRRRLARLALVWSVVGDHSAEQSGAAFVAAFFAIWWIMPQTKSRRLVAACKHGCTPVRCHQSALDGAATTRRSASRYSSVEILARSFAWATALAPTDIGCSGSILRKIRWKFHKYQSMGEAAYVAQRQQEAMDLDPAESKHLCAHHAGARFTVLGRNTAHEVVAGYDIRDLSEAAFFCSSALSFVGLWLMFRRRLRGRFIFAVSLMVYPMIYYLTFPHER